MKIRTFTLIYKSGNIDTTRHYNIKDVENCYLNSEIRSSKGLIETYIKVLENEY